MPSSLDSGRLKKEYKKLYVHLNYRGTQNKLQMGNKSIMRTEEWVSD